MLKRIAVAAGLVAMCLGITPVYAAAPHTTVQVLSSAVDALGGPNAFVAAGNQVYFDGEDAAHGVELWTTDGTAKGTHLVDDVSKGSSSSDPTDLTAVGSRLYFLATSAKSGEQVWETNGGTGATDASSFGAIGCCSGLIGAGSHFFVNAPHMWIGSAGEKGVVSTPYGIIGNETTYKGDLYFTGIDSSSQQNADRTNGQLLYANGKSTGFAILTDFKPTTSSVQGIVATSAGVFAEVWPIGSTHTSLWESQGSNARLVTANGPDYPSRTCVGGSELFYTRTGAHGTELWRTNGQASGTARIAVVAPGVMIGQGNNLVFQVPDGSSDDLDMAAATKSGGYSVVPLVKHTQAIPVAAGANSVLLEAPNPQKAGQEIFEMLLPGTKQVLQIKTVDGQTYAAGPHGVWPLGKDAYIVGVTQSKAERLVKITVSGA